MMINQSILSELTTLLASCEDFVDSNGSLLKSKIISYALDLNQQLLKLLLSNETIKQEFFTSIDDILIFDKVKFQKFLTLKSFLPDSVTAFKNKIGLFDESSNDFLSAKNHVVLSFPYKDGVVHGEQSNDNQKRREIIYHETLKAYEIDKLTSLKVLKDFIKLNNIGGGGRRV